MSAEVVQLDTGTLATPDQMFDELKGEYSQALVIGWDQHGDLKVYASAGLTDGGELLWLIEKFKANLLKGEYEK